MVSRRFFGYWTSSTGLSRVPMVHGVGGAVPVTLKILFDMVEEEVHRGVFLHAFITDPLGELSCLQEFIGRRNRLRPQNVKQDVMEILRP